MGKLNNEILIKIEGVSKVYMLDGVQVEALKNISLDIKKGEFVALMGPSGSGKSTLMHIIGILDTASSGKVFFDGRDTSKMSDSERAALRNHTIGFVFQQFNLLQRISSLENIMLPHLYDKKNNINPRERGLEILGMVGLENRAHHKPNQLSGGQQQRVAIARALFNNPKLILADEPTGNLDTKTGGQIMEILKELNRDGRTVIIVTHEKEIAQQAKRIIRIRDGELES
jgi:putative ABC transport system ATP-binding protein